MTSDVMPNIIINNKDFHMQISASLVLYHNDPEQYSLAIMSFLNGCDGHLYVMDNSLIPLRNSIFDHPRVHYIFSGTNLGFGKAHNRLIKLIGSTSDLHLLLNPDIVFDSDVLYKLAFYMSSNATVGAVMPRVSSVDGSLQRLSKLLPTPVDLIFRRFIPIGYIKDCINSRYEMYNLSQVKPTKVPSLSGCFLLVRTHLLQSLKGFDERYFMYMEDVDLVRRLGDISDTIYYPAVSVVHAYAKGSYRSNKLMLYHVCSAVLYFSKWGWLFDKVRYLRNQLAIKDMKN
jgi:GT2 family glycosyltransferase